MNNYIKEEIEYVNGGSEYTDEWLAIDTKCYYKDGKPYGLIGYVEHNGTIYIAISTYKLKKMTIEMIRDLLEVDRNNDIAVSFSKRSKTVDVIKSVLEKRNGIMSEYDNENYIWYNRR